MIAACKHPVDVLVDQSPQVVESCASVRISQTQLPISVTSTDVQVTCLSQGKRVVLASCDQLDFFADKVLDVLRFENVPG